MKKSCEMFLEVGDQVCAVRSQKHQERETSLLVRGPDPIALWWLESPKLFSSSDIPISDIFRLSLAKAPTDPRSLLIWAIAQSVRAVNSNDFPVARPPVPLLLFLFLQLPVVEGLRGQNLTYFHIK